MDAWLRGATGLNLVPGNPPRVVYPYHDEALWVPPRRDALLDANFGSGSSSSGGNVVGGTAFRASGDVSKSVSEPVPAALVAAAVAVSAGLEVMVNSDSTFTQLTFQRYFFFVSKKCIFQDTLRLRRAVPHLRLQPKIGHEWALEGSPGADF